MAQVKQHPLATTMQSWRPSANMQVLYWVPPGEPTSWPCVDCGLITGNFCDGGVSVPYDQCFASERVPSEYWNHIGQRTPLCSYCETIHLFCRFCRGVSGCTPSTRYLEHWTGVPQHCSRAVITESKAAREASINDPVRTPSPPRSRTSAHNELVAAARQVGDEERVAALMKKKDSNPTGAASSSLD